MVRFDVLVKHKMLEDAKQQTYVRFQEACMYMYSRLPGAGDASNPGSRQGDRYVFPSLIVGKTS